MELLQKSGFLSHFLIYPDSTNAKLKIIYDAFLNQQLVKSLTGFKRLVAFYTLLAIFYVDIQENIRSKSVKRFGV